MQTSTSETFQSFSQIAIPLWIWLPALVFVLFGVWKLVKLLFIAASR